MTYSFIRNVLNEGRPHKLEIRALPYDLTELAPALSKETLEYHYGKLAKGYAKRYNANEGDAEFNKAGSKATAEELPGVLEPVDFDDESDCIACKL
jgi:superoxide dismutase